MRFTLCDTRDTLSATVRAEFISAAWKTRPCGWQSWWDEKISNFRKDSHMHQSLELGLCGSSVLGAWWLLNQFPRTINSLLMYMSRMISIDIWTDFGCFKQPSSSNKARQGEGESPSEEARAEARAEK